jgi:hypothetical protein
MNYQYKTQLAILLVGVLTCVAACTSSPTKNMAPDNAKAALPEETKNWSQLFDGETFAGWRKYGGDSVGSAWRIEDRAIHLVPLKKKGWQSVNGGDLVTDEEYSNFDLTLEWKISKGGSSGIFFYVHEDTTRFDNINKSGLEMQVNDDENHKNGKIKTQKCGDLVGLLSSAPGRIVKPAGEWNLVEIRSDRGQLHFFINGQNIIAATLWDGAWEDLIDGSRFKKFEDYGEYKKGRIALQDHGDEVWFRNIMIKKL